MTEGGESPHFLMNENCVHRGKTMFCQIVCLPDNAAPVCMTNEAYQQTVYRALDHQTVVAFALVGLIVAIAGIMAIRATIQETRNDR